MRSTRWLIATIITVAIAIGYLDRQALAFAIKAIDRDIAISDNDFGNLQSIFFFAYALMYVGGGKMMDVLGAVGFLADCGLVVSRLCSSRTGRRVSDAGGGPADAGTRSGRGLPGGGKSGRRMVSHSRTGAAMGMVNGGSSLGAVVAPPAIALVLAYLGWPWVFYLSGALGLLWTVWWLWEYFPPAQHPRLSPKECSEIQEVLVSAPHREASVSWWRLLVLPQVWGIVLGKCCCDAVWFSYVNWMPKYLTDMRGFDTAQLGSIAWIPYAASGVGSVAGGWLSGHLLRRGYSLNFSRKAVLGASAAFMPCMLLVTRVSVGFEVALFSLAFFAHLSFSTLVITLPADLFPHRVVGSVVGLVGFGGSLGGMFFNKAIGLVLQHMGRPSGYPLAFAIGSTFHILGFVWILLTIRNVRPVAIGGELAT